jgi:alpha-D-ribose 1-methylphosphonate 5-triphosphate synthase subunit PhnI
MAYVAVRGGESAIEASIERLAYERLGKGEVLGVRSVEAGLRSLVDQVMSEGSLYSEEIAALSIKQAEGSPEEAVFLMRAFRSTLPRKHYSLTISSDAMRIRRRISAAFKEIPGGQILGSSPDYTHRLIDFSLVDETVDSANEWLTRYLNRQESTEKIGPFPKVIDYLRKEGLLGSYPLNNEQPKDVTKTGIGFPTVRSERLQVLTRGQTGAVTALGYASLRGYGTLHPTVGELRVGLVSVLIANPFTNAGDEDDAYYIGEIKITEVETIIPKQVQLGQGKSRVEFEIGYGICMGQNETKAIAMSILDQCLETRDPRYPTHDEEFVLLHIDSVEATGFISHLKLPHYVTFQSKLDSVRKIREGTQ